MHLGDDGRRRVARAELLGPQAHLSAQRSRRRSWRMKPSATCVGASLNQTAYLVTSSRRLYRSDDSGATWNIEPLPDADDAPEVVEVHVAAHDARHVFVRGAGITNWMSANGGASYTAYRSGGAPLLGFKWHPLSPGLALAHTLSRGCNESALVDTHAALTADACSFEVVRTDDFGANWKTLASGVLQYEWGGRAHWRPPWWRWQQAHSWRARHALPLGPNARRWMALRRHALTRRDEAGDYVYLLLARPMAPPRPPLRMVRSGNLMRTASDMAHAENLLPHGSVVSFAFQGDHLFAATAHTYRGALASMMVSSDHGRTFHRARGGAVRAARRAVEGARRLARRGAAARAAPRRAAVRGRSLRVRRGWAGLHALAPRLRRIFVCARRGRRRADTSSSSGLVFPTGRRLRRGGGSLDFRSCRPHSAAAGSGVVHGGGSLTLAARRRARGRTVPLGPAETRSSFRGARGDARRRGRSLCARHQRCMPSARRRHCGPHLRHDAPKLARTRMRAMALPLAQTELRVAVHRGGAVRIPPAAPGMSTRRTAQGWRRLVAPLRRARRGPWWGSSSGERARSAASAQLT